MNLSCCISTKPTTSNLCLIHGGLGRLRFKSKKLFRKPAQY